jgi:ribulose-5-phosphate 4-epimerase/fuculose-1-phosphate aldolase
MQMSDLIKVDQDGAVIEGGGALNQAAFAIHSRIHLARPDVIAAAHSHSIYGKAWSSLGRTLDPLTQDSCAFYQDHAVFDDFTGVVLDTAEGDRIGKTLGPHKAVILRNHGLLTVGRSVDEAAWWFITMERTCQAQLLAEAAGTPVPIDPQQAKATAGLVGNPMTGHFSFQPIYDVLMKEEPDFLE